MSEILQVEVLAFVFFFFLPIKYALKYTANTIKVFSDVKFVDQPKSSRKPSPCSRNVTLFTTGMMGHQARSSIIFQAENGSGHFS